ncbi:TIGR03943 family putative permease subunit [Halalkalibacter urbisdiaboli]|uniref:TIGR03943 family putative permease subunit n=1 Tax=Halalkalibacter urbisdiaboli TaxID=1960589 RepID=UPI000B4325E0|nr:TIGR03943 family protein [Halalkalibacter urbisdiaboli]
MNKQTDLGFHAYIRGIILIGFALLMLAFIITGNIRYYIAPSMMPFIYFATGVFLFLGVIQILRSTSKGQEEEQLCDCGTDHNMEGNSVKKLFIYSIFVAPIIFGFVLPDKVLDSQVAANRGIQYGSGILKKPTAVTDSTNEISRAEAYLNDPDKYLENLEASSTPEEHFTVEDFYTEEGFNTYYKELANELLEDEVIIVNEENYLDIMTVLDIHLDQFVGKQIDIQGFVYREPEFADNQLVVARFGMTCCVADASVYGTMVEADDAKQFENDTWVRVKGILDKSEYNDFHIPTVKLREIEIVDEPDNPYVFPTFNY